MIKPEEPGMLEWIEDAIRPLTDEGKFRLERVEYMDNHGDVDIILSSKNYDIKFHMLLKVHKDFFCFFIIKKGERIFFADILFSALSLDIPLHIIKRDPEIHYENLKQLHRRYQMINKIVFEKTKFIQELNRLSREIRNVLPVLDEWFSIEKVDEAYRLYLEEGKKNASPR